MSERGEVEINAIIRGARLNRFHILVVTLCTTVAIFDGFDTQLIAYVGPMIVRDFHIPFSSLGGRIGSIVGPTLGGVLVAAQWDVTAIINVQAIPALIAALCVLGLPRVRPAEDRNKALTLAGAGS